LIAVFTEALTVFMCFFVHVLA